MSIETIETERKKRYAERQESRRKQLAELLEKGTDKEVFDAYLVYKNFGTNIFASEDHIQEILKDNDRVENLKLEYYLDHPDLKTNAAFVDYLNDLD